MFEFVFLQNTQESDLSLGRKLSDFIEEDLASLEGSSLPPAERNIHTVSLFSKLTAVAVISILPLRLSTIVPGAFTGDTNHFQKVNTGET